LTDSLGNTVDCKNAIIVMTSNIGARFIQKRGHMGFQATPEQSELKVEEEVMHAVHQTFNPEFLNRLDEVIIFRSLSDDDLFKIIELLIGQLNNTMANVGVEARMSDEARHWIVQKTCSDRTYGARPLRRALQKYVEDPLSEAIIQKRFTAGSVVEIYLDGDGLQYRLAGVENPDDAVLTR
jgi:ATP-dependent Clp protease ATP-binding subunit ClpC